MKKIVALLLSLCLVLGAASAMAAGEKIALITMDSIDQHWITLNEGAQKAAEELGVTVTFMSPNTKDDAQQIECVNNAVAGGYQAIIVAANGPDAISSALNEAVEAGVKIVYVDSPANVEAEATFSTDNQAAGKTAGEEMIKALTAAGITSGDIGIVNADDDWAHVMLERAKCPMQTYSAKRNDADLVAKDIRLSASGVRFVAMSGDAIARMRLGIPGMFSVYNALSVIACARALGISLDDCAAALDTAKPVKGRAEPLETDGDYTILIDYAVTPDAIDNILTTVREFAPARLVFLFGCGGDRDRGKRPKMGRIAGQKADFVIVTSDNPRTEDPEAIIADILPGLKETHTPYVVRPDRREAIAYAIENHCPGDVIILCGKGHEDYQIIGKTKVHMDEREIVAEILDKRKREKEK